MKIIALLHTIAYGATVAAYSGCSAGSKVSSGLVANFYKGNSGIALGPVIYSSLGVTNVNFNSGSNPVIYNYNPGEIAFTVILTGYFQLTQSENYTFRSRRMIPSASPLKMQLVVVHNKNHEEKGHFKALMCLTLVSIRNLEILLCRPESTTQ